MHRAVPFAAVAILSLSACAQEPSTTAGGLNEDDIEAIVEKVILERPELIEEALIALADKRRQEQQALSAVALRDDTGKLRRDARDFSIGPEDAPVTVVEFFDYRCGFCKSALDWANGLPAQYDGQVRVVFKELPILSANSQRAAAAALASIEQGAYLEMHRRLMRSKSPLADADIFEIADDIGLDLDKLKADMDSEEVLQHLEENRELAQRVTPGDSLGTPLFVIGRSPYSGFNAPGKTEPSAQLLGLLERAVEQAG
ncbi:MAG: DsbA family protein [Pseudomonadota bacterium]